MPNKNNIIVCGDLHGTWAPLNKLINKQKPDIILQTGDYGWWVKFHNTTKISVNLYSTKKRKKWDQYGIRPNGCKIYWAPGNHEDWWSIKEELSDNNEVQPDIFYQRRGSTIKLPDGRTVLFMGGAESIDKNFRTIGHDWFPDEIITQTDIENLPNVNIDIVISHTCPREFYIKLRAGNHESVVMKSNDPSMTALSYVLHKYRPDLWYFGHFHLYREGHYNNTRWTAVNMTPEPYWWIPLK